MEKLDLLKLSKIDKERIKKVVITKYANEEFAVAANRVYVDDQETKFCFCNSCEAYFSELMQRVLMYMFGEYIFTGKNDIKSIISVRDPRTVRPGPESLSTKHKTWFLNP